MIEFLKDKASAPWWLMLLLQILQLIINALTNL